MTTKDLMDQLTSRGFVLIGVPEISGGKMVAAYCDADGFERIRVGSSILLDLVEVQSGQTVIVTKSKAEALEKVDFLLANLPPREEVMPSPEDLEAAKLIREVRTLRLTESDRLVLILKDVDITENRAMVDNLKSAVERWLGDKNSRKVFIMAGDVEVTKVRLSDDE